MRVRRRKRRGRLQEKIKMNEDDGVEPADLVVLAGSLYLFAEFFSVFGSVDTIPMNHRHLLQIIMNPESR